jgi:inorganic pyrophosphatase
MPRDYSPHYEHDRVYICDSFGRIVSPFHEIPLYPDPPNRAYVNMVVEIPQNTRYKMEINKELPHNPIQCDTVDDQPRQIKYGDGYPYNYGAIPQTWENPMVPDHVTGLYGDNDPMDCFDISSIEANTGDVVCLKVIGSIAMVDGGEMDWKVIGINHADPMANHINDLSDLSQDQIDRVLDFLTNYKVPDGKPPNIFYDKVLWSCDQTIRCIAMQHTEWQKLWWMESEHVTPQVARIWR